MYKKVVTLIIALLAGGVAAWAIPSSLPIDFRTNVWDPAAAPTQETVGDITATAAFPPGSVLTWSSPDGLGIDSPSLLGLGTIDILNFTFAAGSGNGLTGAWVTNLFNGLIDESGLLVLTTTTGLDYIGFSGLQTSTQDPLGDVYVSFGGALNVLSAQFEVVNAVGTLVGNQNYSVAGFTSVPDGGKTLTLLGIGLISLMVVRRRFAF
jgi:hypothetical protein